MMPMMGGGSGAWVPLLIVALMVALVAAGTGIVIAISRRESGRQLDRLPKAEDPLAVLRERYARGEIDHDEFERHLGGLLRTETPDSASRRRAQLAGDQHR
jgi:uncharacterized membrane protein